MKHVRSLSMLPARAADNTDDPAEDGIISLAELLAMTLDAVEALAAYLLAKETWEEPD